MAYSTKFKTIIKHKINQKVAKIVMVSRCGVYCLSTQKEEFSYRGEDSQPRNLYFKTQRFKTKHHIDRSCDNLPQPLL